MQSVLQALEEYFGYDVSSRGLLSAYTTLHARNRTLYTVDLCKFFFALVSRQRFCVVYTSLKSTCGRFRNLLMLFPLSAYIKRQI